MAHKIGIYYDEKGLRNIMKGPEISRIEQDIMMQKLSQVRAEFLQTFGFNGSFEIDKFDTGLYNSKRSRISFIIMPTDRRTMAALKKQPGWLGKFMR